MIFFLINQKNEGICYDDEETRKFSCNCTLQYLGERCEVNRFDFDPCDFYQCQNNGTCIVDVINGISTPICECPETHHGATCHLKACNIPCYNGGICDGDACQCSQDNGIAKYHGESCDMPAACDGNPCQNNGECTANTQADDIQVRFVIDCKLYNLYYYLHTSIKLDNRKLRNHIRHLNVLVRMVSTEFFANTKLKQTICFL